ncbi:hypothetical protein BU24DRAFT_460517 [Aaosphaeria arxii CBS 175.79]|uniref:Rhodopsin domain-containing protein n=1 Tax=Aaosphaeria arxii CBS 175.79 TaxID=1450172 RepID=A0A6A5XWZ4_9PLEO|nr:uncharacterized protein BU24DRAFT_460517 [Aaosphaeria arxii CBS 175.79]KAF2017476.1 hypothetical protein BU24DRAFT_460517 [Aaosphaeria arxii CBS 175.79]
MSAAQQVLVPLLACIAIVASIVRLIFRLRQDARLMLDDWFVLFATLCLVCETATIYHYSHTMYFIDSTFLNSSIRASIISNDYLTRSWSAIRPDWIVASLSLAWLSIFSIKCSFLVLFYRMVQNVQRPLRIHFWVACTFTAIAGVIVIVLPFALCPRFDASSIRCFEWNHWIFNVKFGIGWPFLDIATDLMIISIPIALLCMSQLRFDQKLRLAMVLCVSLLCILLSVVRLAGGIRNNVEGHRQFVLVWTTFMLHCEVAVAVLAGSVPALRAIYRTHQKRRTGYGSDLIEASLPLSSKIKEEGILENKAASTTDVGSQYKETESKTSLPVSPVPSHKGIRRYGSLRRNSSLLRALRRHDEPQSINGSSVTVPEEVHHDNQMEAHNQIRITVECTVESEAAPPPEVEDFSDLGNRDLPWSDEWLFGGSQDGSHSEVTGPTSTFRTDRSNMINAVDPKLLGTVVSGMRI